VIDWTGDGGLFTLWTTVTYRHGHVITFRSWDGTETRWQAAA
jgi:hypothetical protein